MNIHKKTITGIISLLVIVCTIGVVYIQELRDYNATVSLSETIRNPYKVVRVVDGDTIVVKAILPPSVARTAVFIFGLE